MICISSMTPRDNMYIIIPEAINTVIISLIDLVF